MQLSFAPVVRTAAPAVVNIYTKRRIREENNLSPLMQDPVFRQFFGGQLRFGGQARERVVSSLGSGVIVDPQGVVVTSNHVIAGSEDIIAVLADGREFNASIITADASSDLALLRLATKGTQVPALPVVNSDALEVGDLVLAIGNPFGVGQTVTSGIVSALARSAAGVSDYQFFIQTDAAINPGNSGGALVNMQGQLIGINTAIYSQSGGSIGVGFAIPSNMVNALLRNVQADGSIARPWLGAEYKSVDNEIAKALGLMQAKGALVTSIFPQGPAEKSGLRDGDVIITFGGHVVENAEALKFRIAVSDLTHEQPVVVLRDGAEVKRSVMLQTPPETPKRDARTLSGEHPLNGVTVINLSPRVAMDYHLAQETSGVIVSAASPQGQFSIRAGDILLAVNGKQITSTQQLVQWMQQPARGWSITFQRGQDVLELKVQL
ncbi:MAG: Do family serine endopeptidase [Rickettsiales bacterium]|nr:Do family serine endopeptidase [Rickettsiales bacterium]